MDPCSGEQAVSSVLYLGDSGGPTLVIDQSSACRGLGSTGWAVHPVSGRLAAFRGNLLHGVLPGTYASALLLASPLARASALVSSAREHGAATGADKSVH